MQVLHRGIILVVGLLFVTPASATPNPNQIDAATAACGKAIEKAVEKFVDKTADAIEKCLLAWQKCDTAAELEEADECKSSLLVLNKGKCAIGKLAPASDYFGVGSSSSVDGSAIGKALGQFIAALPSKCPVNGSVNYSQLGITPTPTTDVELYEQLNAYPFGAACTGHKRVKATIPPRETVLDEIIIHPDVANVPAGLFSIDDPGSLCK